MGKKEVYALWRTIIRLYEEGYSRREIAPCVGKSYGYVYKIIRRYQNGCLMDEQRMDPPGHEERIRQHQERVEAEISKFGITINPQNTLSETEVIDIRQRAYRGQSCASIARHYQHSACSIVKIVNGRYYVRYGGPIKGVHYGNTSNPEQRAGGRADDNGSEAGGTGRDAQAAG